MSDLISRKAVVRLLAQEASHKSMQGFTDDARGLINAKEYVQGLPTAYDMDAVLEKLGELRDTTINTEYAPCETYGTNCVDKAISVVKGGGQGE